MKTAYFGGTFDPIHLGHMQLAAAAVNELGLDEMYFMPNFISPFKQEEKHAASADRLAMIESILHYNNAFRLTSFEIDKAGVSYTFNSLTELNNAPEHDELYFLMGFDSIMTLETWYRGPEILRSFKLVTGVRPGTDSAEAKARIKEYRDRYDSDITVINSDYVDISSTYIRDRIEEGQSLNGLVAPEVEEYIYEHNLYKD